MIISNNVYANGKILKSGFISKSASVKEVINIKDPKNGLYAFIIEGDAKIEGQNLNTRDGFGIWDKNEISIEAKAHSKILLMDVPMSV